MKNRLRVQDRAILMDDLIKDRERLGVALALDDVILVDYLRRSMIRTIMEAYGIESIDEALARFNDLVKGIDEVDPDWQ